MPSFTYRYATVDDADAIVELVQSAYRGQASLAGWTSEAELIGGQRIDAAMLRDLLAEPSARVLLAGSDGRSGAGSAAADGGGSDAGSHAGFDVCCELREPGAAGGNAYFGMFAVRPGCQAGGYGRAVLAEAERIARDDFGAPALEMTVIRQRTALIEWYERRGYLRTGESRPFPYGDDRYGLPTRDDLEMTVLAKAL